MLLEQGLEVLLEDRFPKKAIEGYFDTVIATCPSPLEGGSRYYSSRSGVETIAYMLKAAGDKQDASAIGPTCAYAHFYRGYALLDLGMVEEAKKSLQIAIEFSPFNSGFHSELGHIYQVEQRWDDAISEYTAAEDHAAVYSPEEVRMDELLRAKRGIGFVLIELGKLDEAESKFRECLELDPNDEKAENEIAYIESLRER